MMYFAKKIMIITLIHIFYAISLSQIIISVKILLANQVIKYLKCKIKQTIVTHSPENNSQ